MPRHVVLQRRERDEALGDRRQVRFVPLGPRRRIVRRPVIRPAARVGPLDVLLAVPRDAHRHDLYFAGPLAGDRGNVEVIELRLGPFLSQNLLDDADGDLGCPLVIRVLIELERAGNARDAEKRPFDRRGDRAGICLLYTSDAADE